MSHTFEALTASATNPPSETFDCASKVRWVHVLRSRKVAELVTNILQTGKLEIPSSRPTSTTGESERILGLSPSVYFYAGRAFPEDLAKTAILVEQSSLSQDREVHHMMVAPFDTGAVAQNKTLLPAEPNKLKQYVQEHSTQSKNFQLYFACFLAQFFSSPEDYWDGIPGQIDGVGFDNSSDFRNWTFEVRCEEFAGLPKSHWFIDDEGFGVLQRCMLKPGATEVTFTHQSSKIAEACDNAAKNFALS